MMPDQSIERAVRELEDERAKIMKEHSRAFTESELSVISGRLEEDRLRRRVVEMRADKHEGMPLSLLKALMPACPCCNFKGTVDLQDAEHLDGDEAWVAHCIRCTALVEAASPQRAFEAWNQRDGVIAYV